MKQTKNTKNTTLSRGASNTMHKLQGVSHSTARVSQRGDQADFAFNGQMGDGVNKRHGGEDGCMNPHAHMVKDPDRINHGLIDSNRKGNASDSHADRMNSVGPSVTRDSNRMTIATASQGHPVTAHKEAKRFKNPDAIYMSKAER